MISSLSTSFPTDIDLEDFEILPLFHTDSWFRVMEDGFHVTICYITTRSSGTVLSVTPITIRSRFGFTFCGSPLKGLFTEYMGPRFKKNINQDDYVKIFDSQVRLLASRQYFYTEISLNSSCYGAFKGISEQFESQGFKYYQRPSLVVNLSLGENSVWTQFEGRARNSIRKAEKSGVICSIEALSFSNLDEYIKILTATFARQGRHLPHPVAAYRALATVFRSDDRLIFVGARFDNILIAGGIFLVDNCRMIFHSGCANELGMKYAASSLVQWCAIQEGCRRGLDSYDLGGIGLSSIDKFKMSFGGRPIEHHRWVKFSRYLERFLGLAKWLSDKGFLNVYGK